MLVVVDRDQGGFKQSPGVVTHIISESRESLELYIVVCIDHF